MTSPPTVLFGVPFNRGSIEPEFVLSLIDTLFYLAKNGVSGNVLTQESALISISRNKIVEKCNADYLMFVDTDMVFPPDLLIRLMFHNVDIVNALAFRRVPPHYPCIFKWDEKEKCYETMVYYGGLLEVDATGMAACLIKTKVFKSLPKPWYYYRDHLFSSDLTFCENVRKAGFKVYVDTDLKIGHLGAEQVIDEEFYLRYLKPEEREKWNKGMREFLQERAREKELWKRNESPG